MKVTTRIALPLLSVVLLLSGCDRKQAPTQYGNGLSQGEASQIGGNNFSSGLSGIRGLGGDGSGNNFSSSGSDRFDSGSDFDLIPADTSASDWGAGGGELQLQDRGAGGSGSAIDDGQFGKFNMREGVFPSIYFGFDSSSIAESERPKLQQVADFLLNNSGHHVMAEGHADWYGTSEYNLALGDRRAASVSNYLGTLGITPIRVEKLSKGSLEATTGLSKSQASEDRRVDLIVLEP